MANPTPTVITWVVQNPNDTTNVTSSTTQTAGMNVTIELPSAENQTRYTVQNVSQDNAPQYVAELIISDLVDADHLNLYHLMVTNSLGSAKYYFDINITDFAPTTTTTTPATTTTTTVANTTTTPEGKGLSGGVTAIIVIIVLLVLIVGAVIFYKKYYLRRQTVPHYNLR